MKNPKKVVSKDMTTANMGVMSSEDLSPNITLAFPGGASRKQSKTKKAKAKSKKK
jgi:hypothetical protein